MIAVPGWFGEMDEDEEMLEFKVTEMIELLLLTQILRAAPHVATRIQTEPR